MRQFNVETGIFGNLNVGSAFVVDDQGNVGNTSPASGQVIFWNGTNWIPSSVSGVSAEGGGSSVADPFVTSLSPSGQSEYFIAFAQTYTTAPAIATDLEITGAGSIIPYAISSVSTSGYNVSFAEDIPDNDYRIHTVFGGSAGGAGGAGGGDSFWETTSSDNISYTGGLDIDGGLNFSGHILPVQNSQFDIGSAEYKIRHLYLSDNSLYIGDSQLSVKEDGSMDFPQGITTSGNIYTTKDVIVDGDLDFNTIGGTSASEANDVIKWNGSKWVAAAPTTLGLGGSSASTEVPDSFVDNVPQGTTVHPVTYGPFDSTPRIASTVEVDGDGGIVPYTISGVSETGYHVVFSEAIQTPNYRVHTVFGGKDVYWKTGANALSYTENNVDISRNLYVGQNIGVGTTNPGAKLQIEQNAGLSAIDLHRDFVNDISADTNTPQLRFLLSDETESRQAVCSFSPQGTVGTGGKFGGNFRLFVADNSGTLQNRLTINEDGNVGIGTTNPGASLTVAQSGTIAGIDLSNSCFLAGTISKGIGIDDNEIIKKQDPDGGGLNIGSQGTNSSITFKTGADTGNGSIPYARMIIDSNGNVGIGTASPGYSLEVRKSVDNWLSRIWNEGTSSTSNGLLVRVTASTSTNSHAFGVYANNSYKFTVRSSGNVGIGTSSPSYKLDVRGTLYASGTVKFEGLGANGDVLTNAAKELTTASDKRLKNDLGDCEYGLSEILQVQPKRYTWKEGPEDQQPTVGFFAQDVHPIMPEAAPREAIQNENGEDDYSWGFHSQTIIAALVNATKEQQQIIEDLKSRIETLEQ